MAPRSSFQEPAGGSKSAKFVSVNPLEPMLALASSSTNNDAEKEDLAKRINARFQNSIAQRQQQEQQQQQQQIQAFQQQQHQQQRASADSYNYQDTTTTAAKEDSDDEDDDDEYLDDDDDDPVLEAIRRRRIAELQEEQRRQQDARQSGVGQYRTITQDEFLPETTNCDNLFVVVHFYHDDFERCKIMDHHLKAIVEGTFNQQQQQFTILTSHCKFLRMNATKAPFFCHKLNIRTLPTVLVLKEGKVVHRLTGFEGLVDSQQVNSNTPLVDQWKTQRLVEWLARAGAIQIKKKKNNDDDQSDSDEE